MKKTILVFLAVCTLLLTGCIKQVPTENQNANQPVNSYAEWQTYKNDKFGFIFKYPKNLILEKSDLQLSSPGFDNPAFLHGVFILKSTDKKNELDFIINPDGSGPYFPDKKYKLVVNKNGLSISSVEVADYYPEGMTKPELRSDRLIIATSDYILSLPQKLSESAFQFKYFYDVNSEFDEQTFKNIIASFRFLK